MRAPLRLARRLLVLLAAAVALYALAGALALPALVERRLPGWLEQRYGVPVALDEVAFDPFLLRLRASELRIGAEPFAAADRMTVDLDWASLRQRAWIVSEVRLNGARLVLERRRDGGVALAGQPAVFGGSAPATKPVPLRLRRLTLEDAKLVYRDERGGESAAIVVAPVELQASDIGTLGGEPGRFRLRAALPEGGQATLEGSLALAPLAAQGRLEIAGLELARLWPLLGGRLRLAPPQGELVTASARYQLAPEEGGPRLALSAIAFDMAGLRLARADRPQQPLLAARRVQASDGRFEYPQRLLRLPGLRFADGELQVELGEAGSNWANLIAGDPSRRGPSWQISAPGMRLERIAFAYADRRERPWRLRIGEGNGSLDFGFRSGRRPLALALDEGSLALSEVSFTLPGEGQEQRLAAVRVSGGALDMTERRLGAASLDIDGGRLMLARGEADPARPRARGEGSRWRFPLASVQARRVGLRLVACSFTPSIVYEGRLSGRLRDFDGGEAPMTFSARLEFTGGGSATADGTAAQDGGPISARVRLDGVGLSGLQPLLARHAKARVEAGRASAALRVAYRAGGRPVVSAEGDATLEGVRLREASGAPLLSWRRLRAEGVKFRGAPYALTVAQVSIERPEARLVVTRERDFNLAQALNAGKARPQAEGRDAARPAVSFERIGIDEGRIDFSDHSLVLAFSTRITSVRGTVLDVTAEPGVRTAVQAEGNIEPYGAARVRGRLNSLSPRTYTDLRAEFDNVLVPPLSPYTATFAGYKISSGKLWLTLHYRIEDGELTGTNDIALADFTLGERVEAARPIDVPVELAVSLLKDAQGRIEIAVPVRGNLADPQFDYGHLVREAVTRTLQRVITAPFRLIARAFDGGEGEAAVVRFEPGSARLAPQELEQLDAIGRALRQRPGLALQVRGGYDPELDGRALRERRAWRAVVQESEVALGPTEPAGPISFELPRLRRAVEALLREHAGAQAVERLSQSFARGDAAALHRAMFERLVEVYPIERYAPRLLAIERAEAISDRLVRRHGIDPARIGLQEIETVEGSGQAVTARLALEAASG